VPFSRDHVAQTTIVGTAIAQFAQMAPPPIYGIHKLDGRRPVQTVPVPQVSVSIGGEAKEDRPSGEEGGAEPTQPEE
jgi:hypothetical protein